MWGTLSDEKAGMSFTIAAGTRQRSHSRVRVTRERLPYFTVSDSRLPQLGGPDSRIYIPQEQSDPVIPPGTGFPFRRLLRLAGLRWRYSNPPPHRRVKIKSQPYFTTGCLPPISSSWRRAPSDSRLETFSFQLNPCGHSPHVTLSLTRDWVCHL
jgi:hypothetical protein